MARARLTENCTAHYPDPIRFAAGERVVVHRADDEFPGWHWCTGPDGREGWVHVAFLSATHGEARGVRDYAATEITAPAGTSVQVLERLGEWAWVALDDGRRGWVLERVLAPELAGESSAESSTEPAAAALAAPVAGRRVLETPRLAMREMVESDAPFILELLTDPAFLKYIGDRGVRSLDDARRYVETGPRAMYARLGIGLWVAQALDGGAPIGICGLLKRDTLPDVDVGYAFLPAYRGRGYAAEAARACCELGFAERGLQRILAIVSPGNAASVRVLEKIGFRHEGRQRLAPSESAVDVYALVR